MAKRDDGTQHVMRRTGLGEARAPAAPRLLDAVRDRIRAKHYSYRTEKTYVGWIRRFILHHGKRHPREMGEQEVAAFLTHWAVDRKLAAACHFSRG
jgi:hypothetical protein